MVLTQEVSAAKDAAVEKALHKAASGDLVTSGRILKEHLGRGALELKYLPIGIRKSEQAKEFGLEGSKAKTRIQMENRQKVLDAARNFLATRKKKVSGRALAEKVSDKTGIKFGTVRDHLSKLKAEGHINFG